MKGKTSKITVVFTSIFFILALSGDGFIEKTDENNYHVLANIREMVEKEFSSLETLYKYLHAHPELSLQEKNTSERLASELEKAQFRVSRNIGGYGIVGIMKNGSGPTVMVRTDMDALPIEEKTGLDFASRVRSTDPQGKEVSVMHACGHDFHMTVFVGTAQLLSHLKEYWRGTLVMVGQPAEEGAGGADSMIEDGLFERFPRPNYALALHISPSISAGKVAYCKGYAFANVDSVDVAIRGVGGHGALPHSTKDPVVMSARFIQALQTIVSRELTPTESAVVTVGSVHGGTKHNIIPDVVDLQLTVRSYSEDTRMKIFEAIKRIANGIALSAGVSEDLSPIVLVEDNYTKATYNDPDLTDRISKAFKSILGEEDVVETGPVMIGEDFGHYGKVEPPIPICLFWLGGMSSMDNERGSEKDQAIPTLHSPLFAPPPEPTIKTGVKAMTAAVLELMIKE